jgi:hypothetical protein
MAACVRWTNPLRGASGVCNLTSKFSLIPFHQGPIDDDDVTSNARFVNLKLKGLRPKTIDAYAGAMRRAANA